ncbi:MAG: hypothetical protein Q4G67_04620 [Actinomycetia bacterium]|nr:hypothetical protein [Actinomycetes bacterium]
MAGLALPLSTVFAIQRSLDLAAYDHGEYQTWSEIYVFPQDIERVKRDFGNDAFLSARWSIPVVSNGHEVPVEAQVTSTPENSRHGWFPERTARPGRVEISSGWIDLGVAVARELKVGAGDTVTVRPTPQDEVELTVRSVHDQRLAGFPYVAQIDARPLLPLLPDPQTHFQSEVLTQLPASRVASLLDQPFYADSFAEHGYSYVVPPMTRAELGSDAAQRATASLGLVLVTSLLGAIGGLFFGLREVSVFAGRARTLVDPLLAIGVSVREARHATLVTGAAACVVGIGAGALIATVPFSQGILADSFPGFWTSRWIILWAALALIGSGVLALLASRWRA